MAPASESKSVPLVASSSLSNSDVLSLPIVYERGGNETENQVGQNYPWSRFLAQAVATRPGFLPMFLVLARSRPHW